MSPSTWSVLIEAMMVHRPLQGEAVERSRLYEWFAYADRDWDEVDTLYLDHETIGGG